MRVAIFHNYFDNVGGGECLVVEMARMLHADIITTDIRREIVATLGAEDVRFISLGSTIKIPGLKQVSASVLFWKANYKEKYDFFIFSGEWAVFAARKHRPNLYYCHTPVRAFYDLYPLFIQRQPLWKRPLFQIWVRTHVFLLERTLQSIDTIVCNSKTTQRRIVQFWQRKAQVIHPFSRFKIRKTRPGTFWLSINRLYPEKRIELQLKALRALPDERLLIVGDVAKGDHAEQYVAALVNNLPNNVEVRSRITERELENLYSMCKGMLVTSLDEDFGMSVVEAFSFGKPVVAVNEGGYKETMLNECTGFLVSPNVTAIISAMREIGKDPKRFEEQCRKRALYFRKTVFLRKLKSILGSEKKR